VPPTGVGWLKGPRAAASMAAPEERGRAAAAAVEMEEAAALAETASGCAADPAGVEAGRGAFAAAGAVEGSCLVLADSVDSSVEISRDCIVNFWGQVAKGLRDFFLRAPCRDQIFLEKIKLPDNEVVKENSGEISMLLPVSRAGDRTVPRRIGVAEEDTLEDRVCMAVQLQVLRRD
jgi:hypothetical protein